MASSLRELRQRRNSVAATMKITKAMELIAASRVMKAQARARRAVPYNEELITAVSSVAAHTTQRHPLTVEADNPRRAALLVCNSDRGLAGGFPTNIMRVSDGLISRLEAEGKEVDIYTVGRKALDYFTFRGRAVQQSWTGFSENPNYQQSKEIANALMAAFFEDTDLGGVDELHLVFTRFKSMVSQTVQIVRLLPLEIVESEEEEIVTGYLPDSFKFEPDADTVLDALLPMYIINRVNFALMESAASELASRQQAMHSATENAQELIQNLTRDANQARQAEITQEINEIVGGAGALTEQGQEL